MIQLSGHSEHKRAHFHIHNYNPQFITIIIEYYQICSYVQYMYETTALVNLNFIYRNIWNVPILLTKILVCNPVRQIFLTIIGTIQFYSKSEYLRSYIVFLFMRSIHFSTIVQVVIKKDRETN